MTLACFKNNDINTFLCELIAQRAAAGTRADNDDYLILEVKFFWKPCLSPIAFVFLSVGSGMRITRDPSRFGH